MIKMLIRIILLSITLIFFFPMTVVAFILEFLYDIFALIMRYETSKLYISIFFYEMIIEGAQQIFKKNGVD